MSRKSKARLAENKYVKELLEVLKENPSPSSQEFMEMVAHVGELENRLAEAVDELKTMREEMQKVQNRSLKAVLQKGCKTLETNISSMRLRLSELKEHIVEGCKHTLSAFKTHGAATLDGMGRFFHIKPMLEGMQKAVDHSIKTDNHAIDKIEAFSKEYHEAGRHLKNMGRTLTGKKPIQEAKAPGKISNAMSIPYKADRACMMAAKRSITKAMQNLERLQESAQRKPSVLTVIRENGEKLQPSTQKTAPVKETCKPER